MTDTHWTETDERAKSNLQRGLRESPLRDRGGVDRAIETLDNAIDEAHATLARVTERLTPVLRPNDGVLARPSELRDDSNTCGLADRLDSLTERVRDITDRAATIEIRLDL